MPRTLEEKLKGKRGIRFFGDVHGHAREFAEIAADGIAQGYHLHSLGDLIDKGPASPDAMRLACDLHDAGVLDVTPGNHCEKFVRWMQGRPVKLRRRGLGLTVSQLALDADGKKIAERYFNLITDSPVWSRFGNVYAVHAALHPRMLGEDGPKLFPHRGSSEVRSLALYGETDGSADDDDPEFPKRTYDWVKDIPAGVVVLVGHSVHSLTEITERRNAAGGRMLHLDTGLEKGGKLSYLDISSEALLLKAALRVEDFAPAGTRVFGKAA